MRSYVDIFIDVQDGKYVNYEELKKLTRKK